MTIFVVGNDEDGGFVRQYDDIESLQWFLSSATGCRPGTEPPYEVNMENLEYNDDAYRFDGGAYRTDMQTFKIIEGDERTVAPEELATKIELR